MYDKPILRKNLLTMTHLATGYPEQVELTEEEMVLAKSTSDTDWETMCNSIHERTGIEIIGQMELNTLGGRPIH